VNARTFARRVLGTPPRRRQAVLEQFAQDLARDPCELADRLTERRRARRRRWVKEETQPQRGRLDRENAVIKDVCLLGPVSRNGNRYLPKAMQEAVDKYADRPCYLDHPDGGPTGRRRYESKIGIIRNPRVVGGKLRGDLEYNPRHPYAGTLEWAAENAPELCGLSPNHETMGHEDEQGHWIVQEILEVRSVDLVADPATNRSLLEAWEGRPELPHVAVHHVRRALDAPDVSDRERILRARQILDEAEAGWKGSGTRDERDAAELKRFAEAYRRGTRGTR
jgi:hypothetical protein